MREAVIVESSPPLPHIWAHLALFGVDPVEGALYHWIADPDEQVAWAVVELPDGSVIAGTEPHSIEDICGARLRMDGVTWEALVTPTKRAILAALRKGERGKEEG